MDCNLLLPFRPARDTARRADVGGFVVTMGLSLASRF
jgi:hypothetical protein